MRPTGRVVAVQRTLAVVLASAALGAAAVAVAHGGGDGPAAPPYVILEADGPLRPVVTTVDAEAAFAVAHATGAPHPGAVALSATGEVFDFTDPNGGSWRVVEYEHGEWTYWAVNVGPTIEDPTLGLSYNAAFVVDAGLLPAGATLAFSELATAPLA